MFDSLKQIEAAGWERLADEGFSELIGPLWRAPERPAHRYGFLAEPRQGSELRHCICAWNVDAQQVTQAFT